MTTTQRKSGTLRREEIARAVVQIIGERGLKSLNTASLAAEVGLTSGALFRHFASQEEILSHATRYAVARVEETFPDASLPPAERLLELARNRVRVLGGDAGLAWFVRSEQAALVLPGDAAEMLRDLIERSKRFLLAAIHEGAREGVIRDDIDPQTLLVPVVGTIHALIGMQGFQKQSEKVLEGLMRMLAGPQEKGDET